MQEKSLEQELKELEQREDEIMSRVSKLNLIHEDIVVINRYDSDTKTFLDLDTQNREGRRRSSWYGKILKISNIPCPSKISEAKKELLQVGDVILYNPESAYSLNLANYPEVWILHVDSVLSTDDDFDYIAMKKENMKIAFNIRARHESERARKMEIAMKLASEAKEKADKKIETATR